MKKKLRLRRPSDFKKTYKEGRRIVSPYFVLYARENGLKTARFGVSISKSHFKLATRRNRLRRVAKEFFRKEISPYLKGYDFALSSRRSVPESNVAEAARDLKDLMSKVKK